MKIIGYSERGAMNALFYGMAFNEKDGKQDLNNFLKLVNKDWDNKYEDFELYMECSLSDFGDPDLVIIAKKKNESKDIFFIEAKVSHGGKFSLKTQLLNHWQYCECEKDNKKYDASNLFFQLRLKELFINMKDSIDKNDSHSDRIKCKKLQTGKYREIGKNVIVREFSSRIKDKYESAYFIAIVPQCEGYESPTSIKEFGMSINVVTWENIFEEDSLKKYLIDTFQFNQKGKKSQILNTPIPDDDFNQTTNS